MSPKRNYCRRVNKHAKTLHCTCDRSYTRADHFERHKQFCRHVGEYVAASDPTPDPVSDSRPFYCSCGAGYTAAHAFTRHCRQAGHDGDWLRSTYQPKGHQMVSAPTADIHTQEQEQVASYISVQHQPLETEPNASSPPLATPLGSKDSDLDSPIEEDEINESHRGIEQNALLFLYEGQDSPSSSGLFTAQVRDISDHDEHVNFTSKQTSSQYDIASIVQEVNSETPLMLESTLSSSQDPDTANRTRVSSIDIPIDADLPKLEHRAAVNAASNPNAQADNPTSTSPTDLPPCENRLKFSVEGDCKTMKTDRPKDLPMKQTSRHEAKRGLHLDTSRPQNRQSSGVSKTRRFGRRALGFFGKHKNKIYSLLAAVAGAYAVYSHSSLPPPSTSSGQGWLLDSTALSHIAKDSSMFSNAHSLHKVCSETLVRPSCEFRGTVPLKFNNGKYLVLQSVVYDPQADTNVVSLAKLGEMGLEGDWTANELTIHNISNMELVAIALNSNAGYRLDGLASRSSSTNFPSLPVDMLGDEAATNIAWSPTEAAFPGLVPTTTTYKPYLPSGSLLPIFEASQNTTTLFASDFSSTTEPTNLSDAPGITIVPGGVVKVVPASTPPPNKIGQSSPLRGMKRPAPNDTEDIDQPSTKRPFFRSSIERLKDLVIEREQGIGNASKSTETWKFPSWPSLWSDIDIKPGATPSEPNVTNYAALPAAERISTSASIPDETWKLPGWPLRWPTLSSTSPESSGTANYSLAPPEATATRTSTSSHTSPLASTSVITDNSTFNHTWNIPALSRGMRIDARKYALDKHAEARKAVAEKREELRQKLKEVKESVCPPCEPCEKKCWLL